MNTSGLGGQAANFGIGTLKRMPLKWNQDERQRRSAPSPTRPGLARVAVYVAQVGQARLALGEGWGGGS